MMMSRQALEKLLVEIKERRCSVMDDREKIVNFKIHSAMKERQLEKLLTSIKECKEDATDKGIGKVLTDKDRDGYTLLLKLAEKQEFAKASLLIDTLLAKGMKKIVSRMLSDVWNSQLGYAFITSRTDILFYYSHVRLEVDGGTLLKILKEIDSRTDLDFFLSQKNPGIQSYVVEKLTELWGLAFHARMPEEVRAQNVYLVLTLYEEEKITPEDYHHCLDLYTQEIIGKATDSKLAWNIEIKRRKAIVHFFDTLNDSSELSIVSKKTFIDTAYQKINHLFSEITTDNQGKLKLSKLKQPLSILPEDKGLTFTEAGMISLIKEITQAPTSNKTFLGLLMQHCEEKAEWESLNQTNEMAVSLDDEKKDNIEKDPLKTFILGIEFPLSNALSREEKNKLIEKVLISLRPLVTFKLGDEQLNILGSKFKAASIKIPHNKMMTITKQTMVGFMDSLSQLKQPGKKAIQDLLIKHSPQGKKILDKEQAGKIEKELVKKKKDLINDMVNLRLQFDNLGRNYNFSHMASSPEDRPEAKIEFSQKRAEAHEQALEGLRDDPIFSADAQKQFLEQYNYINKCKIELQLMALSRPQTPKEVARLKNKFYREYAAAKPQITDLIKQGDLGEANEKLTILKKIKEEVEEVCEHWKNAGKRAEEIKERIKYYHEWNEKAKKAAMKKTAKLLKSIVLVQEKGKNNTEVEKVEVEIEVRPAILPPLQENENNKSANVKKNKVVEKQGESFFYIPNKKPHRHTFFSASNINPSLIIQDELNFLDDFFKFKAVTAEELAIEESVLLGKCVKLMRQFKVKNDPSPHCLFNAKAAEKMIDVIMHHVNFVPEIKDAEEGKARNTDLKEMVKLLVEYGKAPPKSNKKAPMENVQSPLFNQIQASPITKVSNQEEYKDRMLKLTAEIKLCKQYSATTPYETTLKDFAVDFIRERMGCAVIYMREIIDKVQDPSVERDIMPDKSAEPGVKNGF